MTFVAMKYAHFAFTREMDLIATKIVVFVSLTLRQGIVGAGQQR